MNQRWLQLLETIEVIGDGFDKELLGEAEIAIVESELKQSLPVAYKEFCQILGTGMLAEFVRIFSPTKPFIAEGKYHLDYAIQRVEEFMTNYPHLQRDRTVERDQWCIDLFKSAFVFGDYATGEYLLLWDLRTYRQEDESYDIYWVSRDMPEIDDPILIGRDFFEFVQDFCYGTKRFESLPESMEASSLEAIPRTFHQFQYPVFTDEYLQELAREARSTEEMIDDFSSE
jgi:hypothetical protein